MSFDPARGVFVKEALRYNTAVDTAVKASFPGAREMLVDTTISDATQGLAAATELLAFYKNPAMKLNVVVEGVDVAALSQFDGSPPVFNVDFPEWGTTSGGLAMLPNQIEINYQTMTTKLSLRG